jgi:4-amino-4-deoxy-L-arabinose transferase-like glycosyltransferase
MLRAALVAGILAGIALRVWTLSGSLGALDGDEAVWGLMARHALDGDLAAFFWGQSYGGTLEVLLTAPIFLVAGSGAVTVRLVPLLLSAAAAYLVWRIGRRTVGEPSARVAAVLFWMSPAYEIWKSSRAHGFYVSGQLLGLAAVLLVLRLDERRSRLDAGLLGLVVGLGVWQTPQVVPILATALAWLAWRRPDRLRDVWIAAPVAVVAALPWLVSNLRHDWWSFHLGRGSGTYASRLHTFFTATLPTQLGLRVPYTLDWTVGRVLGGAALAAALAWLAWLAVRERERLGVLLAVVVAFPFFYAYSGYTALLSEPRYLFVLAPYLSLLLARALRDERAAIAGLGAALALTVVGLARMEGSAAYAVRNGDHAVPDDLAPAIDTLERANVRAALAQYWIATRISFESRERVIAVPGEGRGITPPSFIRNPAFAARVASATRRGYVFATGDVRDVITRNELERAGYRRLRAGDSLVYLPPRAG